jgi:hypothetical protein
MAYKILVSTIVSILSLTGCSQEVRTNRLAKNIELNPALTREEKQFAKQMVQFQSRVLETNQDQAKATFASPNYRLPAELLNSEVFRKWGFNPAGDLTMEEKYYLFSIPQLDDTWKRIGSIDLNKLSPEESRFVKDRHTEYGPGAINLRQKTREKQGSLTPQQDMWFDLIKACTGDDKLDDKGLVVLYRLTPR